MPAFGAPQTPTALSSGDKIAVLNDEDLAANALSMAVALTPQPTPVVLAIYNDTGETVSLVSSPDSTTAADFLNVANETLNVVAVAGGTVGTAIVAPGLFYAIKAASAITAGTVWLAR